MGSSHELEIHVISTNFSSGAKEENCANDRLAEEHRHFLEASTTLEEYLSSSTSIAPKEYQAIVKRFDRYSLKILDIGVGRGESALYLSSCGHNVYALEPSEGFCQLIATAAAKFGKAVKVIRGVSEDIDKLNESNFDVAFFNASLHHCDDPVTALRHCYKLLKPGGKVFLSAELHIRPWVSKRKWYWRLQENPLALGHYGGNEHAYYNWEYLSMLRQAGFRDVFTFPLATASDPLFRLERILAQRNTVGPLYSERDIAARAVYYVLTAKLVRFKPLYHALVILSLVPSQFCGTKSGERL
ncbi:MAG: class I SAM-dependent methyltransferase [Ktedonobacteraceae bacterium]